MKARHVLTTSAIMAIATVIFLPILREPGAFSNGLKGAVAFFKGDYASAYDRFSDARAASDSGKKRDYFGLGASVSEIEKGNPGEAIWTLNDLSFSGSARIDAAKWYDLGNAHAKDALTQSGQAQKTALEAALRAYERSFEIKWMPQAEWNHWEVKKFLESRFPKEPIPWMRPQPPEPSKEPEKNGSGAEVPKPPEPEKNGSGAKDEKPQQAPEKDSDTTAGMDSGKTAGKKSEKTDQDAKWADSVETGTGAAGGSGTWEIAKPDADSLKPESGKWTNAGNLRQLESSRSGTTGTGLSELERSELENNLGLLRDLQRHQREFVRPDGKIEEDSNGGIPDSFQNFFRNDPLFERFFGDGGGDGKNW